MPQQWWYVTDGWGERRWFTDEITARIYLLLIRAAFDMRPGIDIFLGRDVPPSHITKATGSAP